MSIEGSERRYGLNFYLQYILTYIGDYVYESLHLSTTRSALTPANPSKYLTMVKLAHTHVTKEKK